MVVDRIGRVKTWTGVGIVEDTDSQVRIQESGSPRWSRQRSKSEKES